MKNSLKKCTAFVVLLGLLLCTAAAEEAIYPEITEKTLSNGIPVYFMKNTANKIDSVYVGIKGGTKYYTPELSGIENATFLMMGKGSLSYSYDELQTIKYETSAKVSASSGYYGSWLALNTIDDYLDETLPMVLDGFVNPLFEEAQYEKIMNDYSNSVQQTLNDAYSLARYYGRKIIYEGHPYETSSSVTPESLENISLSAIKEYYASLQDSRRFYVIAVTRKTPEELMPVFEKFLGTVAAGSEPLKEQKVPSVTVKQEPMVFTHQSVAGSGHLFRAFAAPSNLSKESIALMIAQTVYSQIMHNVVRAKYGACYSAWSEDFGREANAGLEVIYRCSDFNDIKAQMAEARKIMSEGKYIVSTKDDGSFVYGDLKEGFEGFRNSVINALYSADMTTAARASMLNSSLLMWGNTTGIYDQRALLNTVTCEQVLEAFNKYYMTTDDFWFAVTGPEQEEEVTSILRK